MELLEPSEYNLKRAGRALAEGKLVVIPTETVYGLGADAFNPKAVARVFEAKARPAFDPLIVHISKIEDLDKVAQEVPAKALLLAKTLWPGPLTLILPKRKEIPDIVTSGLDTVAVRLPSHPIARKIIDYSGTAVAAPSANPFGYISPTTAFHVEKMLGNKVDIIVDGGACDVGVESTVIDMSEGIPVVLRPGGMPLEKISELIGEISIAEKAILDESAQTSPGQLASHYAPHTVLRLYDFCGMDFTKEHEVPKHSAAIVFDKKRASRLEPLGLFDKVYVLSAKGDMCEAGARLFALLHEMDMAHFTEIFAERVPDEGLGRAINDRLYRASKK